MRDFMKATKTPIASAVVLALMGMATTAQAQQAVAAPAAAASAPPTPEKAKPAAVQSLDAVVINGIRASIQQSLKVKRDADTHVEVITAEDIGKMPDKNVADSLQRVPGVTISSAGATEGGFDENDRVSMRGTNPSLTQTLVNGHGIASGDWFVLNQTTNAGRSVSYSLLPSELVSQIVVHKSSEASLVEGGVVGSVNIITRKPLEFKNALTLEASVGAVHATLPDKTDPQLSGLVNWRNEEKTLGVMLQVFSEKRHLRRDGVEILGYNQIAAGSAVALSNPDLAGVWYPRSIGAALFEQERKREGGLIDVQLKPTNDLTLDFSAFASKLSASNYNRNYLLHAPFFLNEGRGQAPEPGYVVRNNTLVEASFADNGGNYGTYDQLSRPDAKSSSNFFNFDGKLRVNDALTLSSKLGVSKGEGSTMTQDQASWDVGGGGSWRLNGIDSAPDFSIGTPAGSPAGSTLDWLWGSQNVKIKDKDTWAQLDGEWAVDKGLLQVLKFGVRFNRHDRSSSDVVAQGPKCSNGDAFNWDSATYFCPVASTSPFNPANYPQGYLNYPGNFGSGLGGNFPRNVWYYTPAQLAAFNAVYTTRDPVSRRFFDYEFGLKEKSNAAYVQADLEGGDWSGNVGVRVVQTKEQVLQYLPVDATTPGAITTSLFGAYLPVTTENSYTDVLPSLNLKYKLNRDMVARFAVSRTMTRPDYSALASATTLSPPAAPGDIGTGNGSNPDLKPIRSNNVDVSLEWYFAPRSLLSASAFYMDLRSIISLGQVTREYKTFNIDNPDGFMAPYVLTVPVNSSGSVKGIELAYEQPLFGNFGFATNYTYIDAHEKGGGPLVGASRHTANLSGYFENDRFSARLAYNYRSSFYSGLDRSTAFYQADTGTLSASLGFKLNDAVSISLDAQNLNNPKLKYYALNEDQPRSIYSNGRQYYLNARFKF
jgi:iron complex outermembrane receptor protein